MREDETVVGISAAMLEGTGLVEVQQEFPDRVFDVGIAEQHAVSMGAGMASNGLNPFVSIYSTFLQRAFDQIVHDICIQNLPVTLIADRAGIVGEDGKTHHGAFDISYSEVPAQRRCRGANGRERATAPCLHRIQAPWAFRDPDCQGRGHGRVSRRRAQGTAAWEGHRGTGGQRRNDLCPRQAGGPGPRGGRRCSKSTEFRAAW